jgi:hypothetical protein
MNPSYEPDEPACIGCGHPKRWHRRGSKRGCQAARTVRHGPEVSVLYCGCLSEISGVRVRSKKKPLTMATAAAVFGGADPYA